MNPPQPTGISLNVRIPLNSFVLEVDTSTCEKTIGVFGPSGSGKTTLLESIAGIRRNATGLIRCGDAVWLDTEAKINLPPERRSTGYIPQDQRLFPHLNVRNNLLFGSRTDEETESERPKATLDEVATTLDLHPLLDRSPLEISGGEAQRVSLGRALLAQPKLLLLDEPFASLDTPLRNRVLHYLTRIRRNFDLPLFLVSHEPLEIQLLCDEVIHLRKGKVIQHGTPSEVLSDSRLLAEPAARSLTNVLPGIHASQLASSSRVSIEGADLTVTTPRIQKETGKPVSISIPASDIMLATQRIEGISARNVIDATIRRINPSSGGVLVFSALEGSANHELAAELTDEANVALNLKVGNPVSLVIKTHSIGTHDR